MKSEAYFGFTTSEMLIAMAIIGIIAAITVPAVVANYQNSSMLAMLKKNYVEMQENLVLLHTDNYNKSFYKSKLVTDVNGYLDDYYTITTDCGSTAQPCFANSYRSIRSATQVPFSCSGQSVLVKGGAAICIIPGQAPVSADEEEDIEAKDAVPAHVYLDVNGTEKPNIGGLDMFSFYIYDFYTIDDGDEDSYIGPEKIKDGTAEAERNTLFESKCLTSSTGVGCFGKILNDDWKINY